MTEIIYTWRSPDKGSWNRDNYLDNNREWKEAQRPGIYEQVAALSNEALLDEYTDFAGGDDYDGCHTDGGMVVWQELQEELTKRLIAIGFLEE